MAVSAKLFGQVFKSAFNKEIDLDETDKIMVMLCTDVYVPNQDTHQYKTSVTNEVSSTGYTAGGYPLTAVTVTYNGATNKLTIDANDAVWTGVTFSPRYAVVYYSSGVDATSPLISYVDFGENVPVTLGNLSVVWNVDGIASVEVA